MVTGAFGTKRTARPTASFVQNLGTEQINIIRSSNINNILAGKVAGAQVRSQSAVALGRESMIRLRGENGLVAGNGPLYVQDGTVMPNSGEINPDDIEDITVLQGPAATALFGPEGINGAIVINSKKGRKSYSSYQWSEYKLSQLEEVDYMSEIRGASRSELTIVYEELKTEHGQNATFYFDMADLFYEKGLSVMAYKILLDGVEEANGTEASLKAAAFILERHGEFATAISIYTDLLDENPDNMVVRRELALAYYQDKQYQLSLDTYREIVMSNTEGHYGIRELALDEMNAVIAAHKSSLDLSKIEPWLVKTMPIDLKITLECNYGYINNMQVVEPGGEVCNSSRPQSRSGGRFFANGFTQNNGYFGSYYGESGNEYLAKKAAQGKYRIKADIYGQHNWYQKAPEIIRIIIFKNFQQTGQALSIENVFVDNQYGVVEIGEVRW
ncbi:MAG: TonB-dependent receptor plug domain-containing protein [Chitinophagaceae bacterium]|nr:TonB-dependent receptor plug domain-containing protein [Chitinophagaceae bacterium]